MDLARTIMLLHHFLWSGDGDGTGSGWAVCCQLVDSFLAHPSWSEFTVMFHNTSKQARRRSSMSRYRFGLYARSFNRLQSTSRASLDWMCLARCELAPKLVWHYLGSRQVQRLHVYRLHDFGIVFPRRLTRVLCLRCQSCVLLEAFTHRNTQQRSTTLFWGASRRELLGGTHK
jgi:hypothetical protein